MSASMCPWIPPLLNTLKFDFQAGSVVEVKTRDGKFFRGEVFQNPSQTRLPNSIALINILDKGANKSVPGFLNLFQHEILQVSAIKAAPESIKKPRETVMDTHVVTGLDELNHAISVISGVKEIGCYVPGVTIGRFGLPLHVLLNVKNVLVVIPLSEFKGKERELWQRLGAGILGNSEITKVIFDSRGLADYLFHGQGIMLTNVFDLRVTELLLQKKLQTNPWCDCRNSGSETKVLLTDAIGKYLSRIVPDCDLKVLSTYNGTENESNLKKFYASKVKYLCQLKRAQTTLVLGPLDSTVTKLYRSTIGEKAVAFS